VRRARAGDDDAFSALVRRHIRYAGAIAYRVLGDYEQAADAVQDAFWKAHRGLGAVREPDRFRAWLSGVVRTVAIDARRRWRRPTADLATVPPTLLARRDEPSAPLEEREQREAVRRAVAALPETYRAVVTLKYLAGLSYEEVAAELGTTAAAVEAKLHRARGKLREKLRKLARQSGLKV